MNIDGIKYKAIAIHSGEWVFGSFVYSKRFDIKKYPCAYRIHNIETSLETDVVPETVCRCTGQEDIKGVEIYDNDKVKDSDGHIGIVTWENTSQFVGFAIYWDDGDICVIFNDAAHPFIEVIGNILDDKFQKGKSNEIK